jgi:hypothetical protein
MNDEYPEIIDSGRFRILKGKKTVTPARNRYIAIGKILGTDGDNTSETKKKLVMMKSTSVSHCSTYTRT